MGSDRYARCQPRTVSSGSQPNSGRCSSNHENGSAVRNEYRPRRLSGRALSKQMSPGQSENDRNADSRSGGGGSSRTTATAGLKPSGACEMIPPSVGLFGGNVLEPRKILIGDGNRLQKHLQRSDPQFSLTIVGSVNHQSLIRLAVPRDAEYQVLAPFVVSIAAGADRLRRHAKRLTGGVASARAVCSSVCSRIVDQSPSLSAW